MAHSNQMREFIITDKGIDLIDAYVGPGGVLTGAARLQQETREKAAARAMEADLERRRGALERKRQAMEAQVAALKAADRRRRRGTGRPLGPGGGKAAAGGPGAGGTGGAAQGRSRRPGRGALSHMTDTAKSEWELRLYVAGMTPKCLAAFENLKRICEEHLKGRYHIEIIDLLENPRLAQGDQILAIPTLVRKLPEPLKQDHRRSLQRGKSAGGPGHKARAA